MLRSEIEERERTQRGRLRLRAECVASRHGCGCKKVMQAGIEIERDTGVGPRRHLQIEDDATRAACDHSEVEHTRALRFLAGRLAERDRVGNLMQCGRGRSLRWKKAQIKERRRSMRKDGRVEYGASLSLARRHAERPHEVHELRLRDRRGICQARPPATAGLPSAPPLSLRGLGISALIPATARACVCSPRRSRRVPNFVGTGGRVLLGVAPRAAICRSRICCSSAPSADSSRATRSSSEAVCALHSSAPASGSSSSAMGTTVLHPRCLRAEKKSPPHTFSLSICRTPVSAS